MAGSCVVGQRFKGMDLARAFVYRDESLNVVAVHARYEKDGEKTFQWYRNGKRSLDGLRQTELPLFGASELAKQAAKIGWWVVCEGEKAALALRFLGDQAAVGTPGSSVLPCDRSLQTLLQPKEGMILLWPDADEPGHKHMRALGERLTALGGDVRVVVWPDAEKGEDAYDFIDSLHAGPSLDETAALVMEFLVEGLACGQHLPFPEWVERHWPAVVAAEEEPEPEAAEPEEPPLTLIPHVRATRLDEVLKQTTWLWPRWVPDGYLTILAAEPGCGKSTFALRLVHSFLSGEPWPDGSPMEAGLSANESAGVAVCATGPADRPPPSANPSAGVTTSPDLAGVAVCATGPADRPQCQSVGGSDTRPDSCEGGSTTELEPTVLWVETDDCHGALRDRIRDWGVDASRIVMLGENGLYHVNLEEEKMVAQVAAIAQAECCKLIVVDTLAGAHGMEENSAAMRSLLSNLTTTARELHIPVLACHHLRKKGAQDKDEATMDRVRGSGTIIAAARSIIGLDRPRGNDGPVRVKIIKANLCTPPETLAMMIGDDGATFQPGKDFDFEGPGGTTPKPFKFQMAVVAMQEKMPAGVACDPAVVKAAMHAEGFDNNAIYQARRALGVVKTRVDGQAVLIRPADE